MIIRNSYSLSRHVTGSKGMGSLRPSGPAPSYHRLPFFFWLLRFCDDDVEKIYVRDSTVILNDEIHKMYDEILNELGDLATVVSRNYVYGRIKDRTGLSIRHISRIINHTKVEEI